MVGETCIVPNIIMAKHLTRCQGISEILHVLASSKEPIQPVALLYLADSLAAAADVLMDYSVTDVVVEGEKS